MKRIKNSKQLLEEKKRLQGKKAELEKAIKYDWRDVKDSVRPGKLVGRAFSSFYKNKEKRKNGQACLADGISGATANLVKKAVTKAEESIESWLKK